MPRPLSAALSSRLARRASFAFLAGTALTLAACGSDEISCPTSTQAAVIVTVRDSVTGEPAATGASGGLRSPSVIADFTESSDGLTMQAVAPAGRYEVTVDRGGYQRWVQSRVEVDGSGCSVNTTAVEARLQPL